MTIKQNCVNKSTKFFYHMYLRKFVVWIVNEFRDSKPKIKSLIKQ